MQFTQLCIKMRWMTGIVNMQLWTAYCSFVRAGIKYGRWGTCQPQRSKYWILCAIIKKKNVKSINYFYSSCHLIIDFSCSGYFKSFNILAESFNTAQSILDSSFIYSMHHMASEFSIYTMSSLIVKQAVTDNFYTFKLSALPLTSLFVWLHIFFTTRYTSINSRKGYKIYP